MMRSPAKINLCLHLTGRRHDGYHELESLAVPLALHDTIHLTAAAHTAVVFEGPDAAALNPDRNSVRAALDAAQQTAAVRIIKRIPIGAGLGGGSSNAATVLLRLAHEKRLEPHTLPALARGIGADVPFFLEARTAWMRGIGDVLTPLIETLPEFFVLLVKPPMAALTADVYAEARRQKQAFTPPLAQTPKRFDSRDDVIAFLRTTANDLEKAAMAVCPPIGEVMATLRHLPHARLARMTGSGACCFALYDAQDDALMAAQQVRQTHPAWWVEVTRTA